MKTEHLNSLCELIFTGLPPRLKSVASVPDAESIPVVGIRTLTADGELDLSQLEEFHAVGALPNAARPLKRGDVLLSIRGSLPKTALVEVEFATETYASGNLAVLRSDRARLEPAYLWSLMLRICRDENHPLLTRATTQQLSIRMSALSALEVPAVTLDKQRAIGRATTALRDAMRAQRDALDKGNRALRAFLTETFPAI